MRLDQHDDHCRVLMSDGWWRVGGVNGSTLILTCETGCCCAHFDMRGFDAESYCDHASMNLRAASLRAERGLPVTAGSGARN